MLDRRPFGAATHKDTTIKLFRPKAAKAPADAAFHFHFNADYRNPDGTFKPSAALPQLPEALAKVAQELARLRAVTTNEASVRYAPVLQAEITRRRAELDSASTVLTRKRAQASAGVIEVSEARAAHDAHTRCHAALRALLDELRRREQIEQAKAELAKIREALQ